MSQHEIKQCPRCKIDFECKTNNVLQCRCAGVPLAEKQRIMIADDYGDCLCTNCLHYFASGQDKLEELIAYSKTSLLSR